MPNTKISFHLILALIIATALYLVATKNGNILTYDSCNYIGAAQNYAEKGELLTLNGETLIFWPPLYPLILSLSYPYIQQFVKIFNLLCLLGISTCWWELSKVYFKTIAGKAFILLLAGSTLLLMDAVFVLTELFFILLFSVYILLMDRYLRADQKRYLIAATFMAFLMLLQRNAGIFVFTFFNIGLFLFSKGNYLTKGKTIGSHYMLGMSGIMTWNICKFYFERQIEIIQELVPYLAFSRNIKLVLKGIGSNFIPANPEPVFAILVAIVILAFVLYYSLYVRKEALVRILGLTLCGYVLIWL
ncbi:MAG: hypothetical protein ACFCUU_05185, partial [Cyclobacteriaceae bacterium]